MQTDARLVAQRLDVPIACLEGLDQLTAKQAGALRLGVENRLSRIGNANLRKLAMASKLIPARLGASIAQSRMGPLMTAGMTAYMDADTAAKIAQRLSPEFLADVVPFLYGNSVVDIVTRLPEEQVVAVTKLLDERGDYLTLASLVEDLPSDLVARLMFVLSPDGMKAVVPLIRDINTVMSLLTSLPEESQTRLLKLISQAW